MSGASTGDARSAILERVRLQAAKKLPANKELQAVAAKRFTPFFETFNASPISRIREWDPVDKADYRKSSD